MLVEIVLINQSVGILHTVGEWPMSIFNLVESKEARLALDTI
jgi:hypothetical protein